MDGFSLYLIANEGKYFFIYLLVIFVSSFMNYSYVFCLFFYLCVSLQNQLVRTVQVDNLLQTFSHVLFSSVIVNFQAIKGTQCICFCSINSIFSFQILYLFLERCCYTKLYKYNKYIYFLFVISQFHFHILIVKLSNNIY